MVEIQEAPHIEGYQLGEEIGKGGVGVVYSALDLSDKTLVAIKVLKLPTSTGITALAQNEENGHSSSSNSLSAQRLFQELVTATRVQHPNAVKILDFGVSDNQELYVVMELLVGVDMSHFLKQRAPLPLKLIVRLFQEMLGAIELAHEQQIVHQDIKPSNLFLTIPHEFDFKKTLTPIMDQLSLIVMDFGIARRVTNEQTDQQLTGSLPYMAPEYLQHSQVSAAGDVYQLGLTLIELIVGARAIRGKGGMQIMYQHVTGDLNIPEPLKSGEFGHFITRSTALDPKKRYQNAAEMRQGLLAVTKEELERVEKALLRIRETDGISLTPELQDDQTVHSIPSLPTPFDEGLTVNGFTSSLSIASSVLPTAPLSAPPLTSSITPTPTIPQPQKFSPNLQEPKAPIISRSKPISLELPTEQLHIGTLDSIFQNQIEKQTPLVQTDQAPPVQAYQAPPVQAYQDYLTQEFSVSQPTRPENLNHQVNDQHLEIQTLNSRINTLEIRLKQYQQQISFYKLGLGVAIGLILILIFLRI